MPPAAGKVYLIGAGPGDPGLITLRGQQLVAAADLVLYDYLVNPRIVEQAAPTAEVVCLGRHGEGRILTQDEIHEHMISAAAAGRNVARLKGGDTAVFARTTEETAALDAAGIAYEVVPGVTAMQAASAYTGIPLTHRDHASCIALVTGQQGRDALGGDLDYRALAQFPGTLAFYMGVTTASVWSAALIDGGKSPETPTAIVRRASLPGQKTIITTLGELSSVLAARQLRPPAIIFVGDTVAARAGHDWFASRPLFGRTVLVTRPADQAGEMVDAFSDLGAKVLVQPAIEIKSPADPRDLDQAVAQIGDFDWLVFSSANGVRYFLARLEQNGRDLRALGDARIASIGSATTAALAQVHLRADVTPDEYRAEALAEALSENARGNRFLLVRASRGREVLADALTAAGALVTQVVAYESRDVESVHPEIADALSSGQIDWVTATSSAIAKSLVGLYGADLRKTKLAAISPLTAGVLTEAGYSVAATAVPYTADGVIRAIVETENDGLHFT